MASLRCLGNNAALDYAGVIEGCVCLRIGDAVLSLRVNREVMQGDGIISVQHQEA